jgi:hypothetical protein
MSIFSRTFALGPALLLAAGCVPTSQPVVDSGSAPAAVAARVESAPAEPPSRSEQQLVEAYKAAHAHKDAQALLALYWFGSADDEMRLTIRENVDAELRCPLIDVKLEPVKPGEHGPTVEGGLRWRPSLNVVAVLTANFDTSSAPAGGYYPSQVRQTVGRRGNRYYFTVPLGE